MHAPIKNPEGGIVLSSTPSLQMIAQTVEPAFLFPWQQSKPAFLQSWTSEVQLNFGIPGSRFESFQLTWAIFQSKQLHVYRIMRENWSMF